LDGAVLAAAAVQRDEAARIAFALELEQVALGRIEGMRVDALRLERFQHAVAAQQRNLALGGLAAHQHGDFSERAHAGSPTIFTSVDRRTPFSSSTFCCTCSISHSMSAALAAPPGLTMKLACFSEMRAPLRSSFFRPLDWIRRAAVLPSDGLRNTLPAFGSCSGCVARRLVSSAFMISRDSSRSPSGRRKCAEANHSSPSL